MAVFQKRGIRVGVSPDPYSGTNLLVKDGLPVSQEGDVGQLDLRKVNGKYFLFTKVAVDDWRKVSQLVKTDGIGNTQNTIGGQEEDGQNETFNDVSINNLSLKKGTSNLTTTGNASFGAITSGAVIWQSFPFIVPSATNSRYYFLDGDDTANSYRRWDSYDTSPTGLDYRGIAGQFVIPEDCKLVAMHGVISNTSNTANPTVHIYHGSVTESTSNTTLASAGNVEVSIGTSRVPYKFNKEDFNVNLSAGNIIVPMIVHSDVSGTRNFQGSVTLKFVTR